MSLLCLKKNEERRLLQGHVWIYSNEVDVRKTPFSQFTPGQIVRIEDSRGRCLGIGYVNPYTLLCARLLTRDPQQKLNEAFFEKRIAAALHMRERIFDKPFYRLIYGESDDLPGLIVDRYGDLLVAQITTAGIETLREPVLAALKKVIAPKSILLRNDHSMRKVEGLAQTVEAALGEPPQTQWMEENGVKFSFSPWSGQKTGWFYDHRDNRRQLERFVRGKRVLDVFSYVGAWAVQAAVYGAKEVWALDSSERALEQLKQNAAANGVETIVQTIQADAFDCLKQWQAEQRKFDVIILDPPAFIKKRKDYAQGLNAYQRLNALALSLLTEEGYLISASCSQHCLMEDLQQAVLSAGLSSHCNLKILARGHQGYDHPIHPAIPETDYLKTLFCYLF